MREDQRRRFLIASGAMLGALVIPWAHAQNWDEVGDSATVVFYVDRDAISRDGHMRRWWLLQNLKAPDRYGYLSYTSYIEGDCKELKVRSLQTHAFRMPMAGGERAVSSTKPDEKWTTVGTGTVDEVVLKVICRD